MKPKIKYHTPNSGDWLVITDENTGEEIYNGHGHGDQIYDILDHLGVNFESEEYDDDIYEEKFC